MMEIRRWFNSHTLLYIHSRQVGGHLEKTIPVAIEIIKYKRKAIKSIFYNKAQNSNLVTGAILRSVKHIGKTSVTSNKNC